MGRTRLYSLVLMACLLGYAWLSYLHFIDQGGQQSTVCLIKEVTHVPCPSCGSSRSVMSIMSGDFVNALKWNPLGYVLVMILFLSPGWIAMDIIFKKKSFFQFYHKVESLFKIKWVTLLMIGLITVNWIWNIAKHL